MATPTPTIPTFTDGTIVHATDLNALASNLTNLYNYNQASFNSQRPAVSAVQTSGQSITNSADTLITFNSAALNTDNMWVSSVANQLTIQHAGIYLLMAQVRFPSVAGGNFAWIQSASILVNGTSFANAIVTNAIVAPAGGAGPGVPCSQIVNLAAGATVYLNAFQSTGGAQTLATNAGGSFLAAVFLTSST